MDYDLAAVMVSFKLSLLKAGSRSCSRLGVRLAESDARRGSVNVGKRLNGLDRAGSAASMQLSIATLVLPPIPDPIIFNIHDADALVAEPTSARFDGFAECHDVTGLFEGDDMAA